MEPKKQEKTKELQPFNIFEGEKYKLKGEYLPGVK